MDNLRPNNTVRLVFKESTNDKEGVTFLQMFLEGEEGGRDITNSLLARREEPPEGPTLAECWGVETLQFIEAYMREQVAQNQLNGFVLQTPKKRDMN